MDKPFWLPHIWHSVDDVIGLSDHLYPGLGEIEFTRIATFLSADAFRALELKPGNTLAQVMNGLHLLENIGVVRYLSKEQ
jgi:hypothetical protein